MSVGIAQIGDEADRFRIRNGVGEALREARVARELEDAHLAVLVRRELRGEVVERLPRRVDHAIDVVRMLGVVVDLDRQAVPIAALHLPARRQVAEERQHRAVHLVVEVTASVLGPLALQIARRERDLVRAGADCGLEVDPVGIREAHGAARRRVFELGCTRHVAEPALAALVAIDDLRSLAVPEMREHGHAVEERAVVVELRAQVAAAGGRRHARVGEATLRALHGEIEIHRRAGRQRLPQLVDAVAGLLVVDRQLRICRRSQFQLRARIHRYVQLPDRRSVLVDDAIVAADLYAALLGVDVHVRAHVDDARLRQVLVLAILLLVARLAIERDVRGQVLVQNVGVVEDPAADRDEDQRQHCDRRCPARRAAHASPARHRPRHDGAAPRTQKRRGDQQQHRDEHRPVRLEPTPTGAAVPVAVHVRISQLWGAAKDVEVVLADRGSAARAAARTRG